MDLDFLSLLLFSPSISSNGPQANTYDIKINEKKEMHLIFLLCYTHFTSAFSFSSISLNLHISIATTLSLTIIFNRQPPTPPHAPPWPASSSLPCRYRLASRGRRRTTLCLLLRRRPLSFRRPPTSSSIPRRIYTAAAAEVGARGVNEG